MSTDPINVGNPYGNSAEEILDGQALSGESLMLYLSTRLNDLDEDIQALMGQAQKAIERKQYINEVKRWADKVVTAQKAGDDAQVQELMDSFPEPPAGERDLAVELKQTFNDMCPGAKGRSDDNLQKFNGQADSLLDEINGQSELCMIRLQQLMGQRQMCVQFATNSMATLSQSLQAITSNFRG